MRGIDDLPTTLRSTDMDSIGVIKCEKEQAISSYCFIILKTFFRRETI